ncbi:MAG: hypothetical protein JJU40_08515 [Rhodobacteraceae bacterium]|nr:hypothetical protein [Paracoccaceae bacterium]
MLYVDIPTPAELRKLVAKRGEAAVSLYLPTTPETQHIGPARTTLGQLAKQADAQLEAAGVAKRTRWAVEAQIEGLAEDDDFWAHQANGLAIFVTPDFNRTYRLPTHLTAMVQVSDRFHIKPLLRATSVGQHAFVLALEENDVRLIEVFADLPAREVRVPALPKDAASAVGTANINSRSASGRIQGGEGQKVRLRQYCRQVDAALRPVLAARSEPLILAATDPLLSLYREVNNIEDLVGPAIAHSPARMSPADLAGEARKVLDILHEERLGAFRALYDSRAGEGRATADVAQAARAATFGAVDTLLVDIDEVIPGSVDEKTGAVHFTEGGDATTYGVVDEIAGRTLAAGGEVMGVRREDIPGGGALAAVLRYAV